MATRKRKATTKSPARKTRARRPPARTPILLPVSHEERWRMVAETAYYIAQQRGFTGGDAVADWLAAEGLVDARLRSEGRAPE